jgi:AcrR family transcriptional regulator
VNKRETIFKTGVRLFAAQGFEATTTLQVAREVGVTEPAVFYHVKSKSAFFSTILEQAISVYIDRIDALDLSASTAFDNLTALIRVHFAVVAEDPELMHILLRTCPARLEDPDGTCITVYREARSRLKANVKQILEKGVAAGDFHPVAVDATANLLIAMLIGLMRQQVAGMDTLKGVEAATIEFCRRSLVVRA